ncbi:MAG: class II aldolase/adducin family protein [Brevinema sp.]
MPIEQLITFSQSVASDVSAIQGAGGNTSIKDNDTLYVKASGTLLSEMSDTKGWAKLNLQQWQNDFKSFNSSIEDEFVAINTNNTTVGGRASIETGLHALLPHKYVLHTHSVYANIFLCGGETQKLIKHINERENVECVVIPACAPGLQLTNHLARELQNIDNTKPIIVLLENHGIAISCDDIDKTMHLHDILHNRVREYFGLPIFESFTIDSTTLTHVFLGDNSELCSTEAWRNKGNISPLTKRLFDDPKVFFPDQVVYVNNKLGKQIKIHKDISNNDYILYQLKEQQAKNTAEILSMVVYLYEHIKKPRLLSNDLCEYISNMSVEKYRQQLEK